jgi:hypothetical protein
MAIFLSDLMTNGAVVNRSPYGGQEFDLTANVRVPAATRLLTTDKILVGRFPTGTIFDQIIVNFPDLDAGTQLTLNVGYDRPVTDPSKAYNATTNPYITGAIATADEDFFEAAATTGQAGGVLNLSASGFTVTTSPVSTGFVDVSITPAANAQTATAADGTIQFLIKGVVVADNQTQGEFSGANAYNYKTNYNI